jgi:lipopolysaccharide transport system ATP-binding protein
VDIRQQVGLDIEYEVLKSGYVLSPYCDFFNEEGVLVFAATDLDPTWLRRPRPAGLYVSTAWIPGNFLSEGTLFIKAALATMEPVITQFSERDVVAFQVIDCLDGESARGDWTGRWGGAVRPLLKWTTQCRLHACNSAPTLSSRKD